MGEQKPNSDAKVFEVQIRLTQSDSILKPAMTTANQIFVNSFDSVLFVPIDAVFSDEGQQVVYKNKSGKYLRTPIKTGESNENFVIVLEGLNDGDLITLNKPD